jgi:fatty acid desaturase
MAYFSPMRAKAILTPEETAEVRQRSNWKGLGVVAHCWGAIFAAMALFALWPNPFTFVLGVMIIGARQLGLAVLMHDAAHRILLRHRGLNEWVGKWLTAHPVGADMIAYRHYHLKHHARTQQPDDPDIGLSAPFPITRESLWRKVFRDLTGQTFFKQRKAQVKAALGKPEWPLSQRIAYFRRKLGPFLLTNVVLLAGLTTAGQWHLYFVMWLLPLATWNQLALRIRNIAEHAVVPDNDDPLRNARTTRANLFERMFLAPYWVNYHVEHHLFMWVPCYNLPKLHRMLIDKGYGPEMEIKDGYLDVLKAAAPA